MTSYPVYAHLRFPQQRFDIESAATGAMTPGELCFIDFGGNEGELYLGTVGGSSTTLVSSDRQVEVVGDQTITGNKTIDIGNLKVTGGASGQMLSTDGAGNLSWVAGGGGAPPTAIDGGVV
jgi:hypothetical protein